MIEDFTVKALNGATYLVSVDFHRCRATEVKGPCGPDSVDSRAIEGQATA